MRVQRLAPEKGTMRCLEALAEVPRTKGQPLRWGHALHARGPPTPPRVPTRTRVAPSAFRWLPSSLLVCVCALACASLDGKRPVHLVIAGDGPSRKGLDAYAHEHNVPVTFVGNLPNTDLPPLYRAADLFVTGSTSETYGLTVLEALACGTPVTLPHCGVFDELWVERIPKEWIYDEATPGGLLASLRIAGAREAKVYLTKNPIKASWQDATHELLQQYEAAIEANLPKRQVRTARRLHARRR